MKLEELLAVNNDFSHLSGMMKEAAEKSAADKKERLLNVLVSTRTQVTNLIQAKVQELRKIRERERACLKQLEDMNNASNHFNKTANPLPFYLATNAVLEARSFCMSVGVELPSMDDKMWQIQ